MILYTHYVNSNCYVERLHIIFLHPQYYLLFYTYTHIEAGGEDDQRVKIELWCVIVTVWPRTDLGCSLLKSHAGASHSRRLSITYKAQILSHKLSLVKSKLVTLTYLLLLSYNIHLPVSSIHIILPSWRSFFSLTHLFTCSPILYFLTI